VLPDRGQEPRGYPAGNPGSPEPLRFRPDVSTAGRGLLYEERIGPAPRAWRWLPIIVVITSLAVAPVVVPIAIVTWFVNVVRYRGAVVRIDDDYVWVNRRWLRLAALDEKTLGRASNTWPWRSFNPRYLGANPIWTSDSVGIRGVDGGSVAVVERAQLHPLHCRRREGSFRRRSRQSHRPHATDPGRICLSV